MSFKLLKSTIIISAMTTISRVFGLIRDIVIGALFGPGLGVDVFIVSFRIPNFLRRLFAEGGFSQAFVPVLSEYKEHRKEEDVQKLIDQTSATLGLILFVITVIGVLISPILIMIFAPGFLNDASKSNLASELLKITFPYIFFISLTAFAGGILNTYKHFAIPAFTPVLLNISLIACAIWLAPLMETPIKALAWAVLIAGFVQLLFQAPFLLKIKKFPRPSLKSDQDGVRRILKLMLPILFAVSIVQINLLIDTLIASFLTTGSISWLYFSDRLVEFPLGVFGIALATAVLPNLSEKHAQGSSEKFSDTLDWSMRCIFLIALPATIGLAMLAAPLLITLFNYKEFSILDVLMTSYSLKAYAIGLPAFVLIKVLSAGFFSRQDTKTPVKIGLIAVVANIVLNILLVWLFNYINLAHVGLALATSLSAYLQAFLLFRKLKKIKVYRSRNKWLGFIAKIILALAVMVGIIVFGVDHSFVWVSWDVFDRILNLMLWILVSMLSYFSVLWLTGLRLRNITTPE
tara:strand:- start:4728 stop:6281 length:1554 start_codon:yes stop_codon:yes gene_type:complete